MKKRNNTAIRQAWKQVGALTDAQILEAAALLKPKVSLRGEKRVKSRKGKAKK